MSHPAYPLAWPNGWRRTPVAQRKAAAFKTREWSATANYQINRPITVAGARARLATELDLLGATLPVLSSNVELRLDGQPRSGQPEPADPGVAVYFQLRGKARVLACDKWLTVAGNIAAIAAHIGAMRGMDRWGVGSVDQLFEGFVALPAPTAGQRHWREVLDVPPGTNPPRDVLEKVRNQMAKRYHPDMPDGSTEAMAAINVAFDQAVKELGL